MKSRPICVGCGVFLGVLLFLLSAFPINDLDYSGLDGESVTLTGYVEDIYYKSNAYKLVLTKIDDESVKNSKVLLSLSKDSYLPKIGAKVSVNGKVSLFSEDRNEGQFSLRDYYHIRKIEYSLKDATIIKASSNYDRLGNTLYLIKNKLSKSLEKIVPEKESSLLKAILLGNKNEIDLEIKELYQNSGISHALCISGLHISMLGLFFYKGLQRLSLSRITAGIFAGMFLIFYGLMCADAQASFRAITMFLLTIIADLTGRAADLLTSLSIAGIIALLINPLFIYDSGFLLSYLALIAIGSLLPVILGQYRVFTKLKFLQGLALSLSISILTLPVTLYFFYQYPVYSLLLNFILIPFLSIVVCLGFAGMIVGVFFTQAGIIICYPVRLLLAFYEKSADISQRLPGALYIAGRPSFIRIVIYYTLILLIILFFREKKIYTLLFLLTAVFICTLNLKTGLTIKVLDVGQGNGIYLGTRDVNILCDGGSSDIKQVGKYRIEPALKAMGVGRLDAIFISHMDDDHTNGIIELIDNSNKSGIKISRVFLTGNSLADIKGQELYKSCVEKNIRIYEFGTGDSVSFGELIISCLYPERRKRGDENELSMVLDVSFGEFCALLPGDLENSGEEDALKNIQGKYNCYIVAHHGSKGGSSEKLLSIIRPDAAIVSCGVNNSYGHPHIETLERLKAIGSKIYISSESGAITVKAGKESFNIEAYLQ